MKSDQEEKLRRELISLQCIDHRQRDRIFKIKKIFLCNVLYWNYGIGFFIFFIPNINVGPRSLLPIGQWSRTTYRTIAKKSRRLFHGLDVEKNKLCISIPFYIVDNQSSPIHTVYYPERKSHSIKLVNRHSYRILHYQVFPTNL